MTDTTPPPATPSGTTAPPGPEVPSAAALRRAVVLVLERSGPLPPWRIVSVLAGADVSVTPEELDRLVDDGVISRVRGPGDAELLALPAVRRGADWRAAIAAQPPAVMAAATVALVLVLILVLMAINGPDASWPAIDWGPPP